MPEKDPTTWTAATWLLALGMAFGGGAVASIEALQAYEVTAGWPATDFQE